MKYINSPEELFSELDNLDQKSSVSQFYMPGKGQFTLVFQGYNTTVQEDVDSDEELRKMIHESLKDYEAGSYMTTSDLIDSLNKEDFSK